MDWARGITDAAFFVREQDEDECERMPTRSKARNRSANAAGKAWQTKKKKSEEERSSTARLAQEQENLAGSPI